MKLLKILYPPAFRTEELARFILLLVFYLLIAVTAGAGINLLYVWRWTVRLWGMIVTLLLSLVMLYGLGGDACAIVWYLRHH